MLVIQVAQALIGKSVPAGRQKSGHGPAAVIEDEIHNLPLIAFGDWEGVESR